MSLNRLLVTSALLLAAASARAQEPVTHTPPVEEALPPATGQPLPNGTAPPATGLGTTTPLRQLTSVIVSAQPFRFTGQVDMDGRGGAFFADEIDDDTVLGSDDGIFAWAATYVGVFAGFGQADNRIVDVDGFANWGNPAPERLCVWMPIAHRAWSRAAVAKVHDVACDQNAHPAGTTPMTAVSLRLPDDVSQRLCQLAARTGRSRTFYILAAIREHLT